MSGQNPKLETPNAKPAAWPPVTCLCPTYGRFERLRDAVACFLLQDYPGERRLLIFNDARSPITVGARRAVPVSVINTPTRFATLGHKRQALLEAAQTALVAHWDDDDLYLPWHITQAVSALHGAVGASGAKPGAAWWGLGVRECFEVRGPCHNVFEGQMLFDRERALQLGGYPPRISGQAGALLGKFKNAGELHTWNPADRDISYVYRWADGLHHISGSGDNRASHDGFGEKNRDFGAGEPLIPSRNPMLWARARLARQFRQVAMGVLGLTEDAVAIRDRLRLAIEPELRRTEVHHFAPQ